MTPRYLDALRVVTFWTPGHAEVVSRDNTCCVLAGLFWHGARRTRTADLLGAIQALSQLSYSPGTREV
jgi:hypothetical protein